MTDPVLVVHLVSASFADAWPSLAREAGLSLETAVPGGPPPDPLRCLALLAGGGEEASLPGAARALRAASDVTFAAVGAAGGHRQAVAVMRAGASDYFVLPADLELLKTWLKEGADRLRAFDQRRVFAEGEAGKYQFEGMLGASPALTAALARAARVIPHAGVTVLVTGETGTGKELLARAIHYNGPRREAPFVDINCAALPEHLLESELFGHEKGAFTDASAAKPGLFEMAQGGTIFLDEIGHLAIGLQGKLLRALQERSIRRVGGTRSIAIDVRIIAATHVELEAAVKAGEFREDLFYRLNVVPVELPALRDRREDIVPLARHFLARFAGEYGIPLPTLTSRAERQLVNREWPGNIRELRNVLERTILLGTSTRIDAADLEFAIPVPRASASAIPFPAPLASIISAAVARTLEACGGNKSEAARQLGISRPRLQRLLDHPGEGAEGDRDA